MGDRLWAGIPSRYVTSQLGQLSLASLRRRLIEYHLRLGWQVTLCDSTWHVSSSSCVATSVRELLYPCYITLQRIICCKLLDSLIL